MNCNPNDQGLEHLINKQITNKALGKMWRRKELADIDELIQYLEFKKTIQRCVTKSY